MQQVIKFCLIFSISFLSLSSCSYDDYTMRWNVKNKKLIVAVILPLTGENAKVSQGLLNAINLSYYQTGNPNIVFKIYDLDNSSKNIQSVVKQIISDGAQLILGPVFSETTTKVLALTDEYSIPVVSFSNDISLLQKSDNIFLASYPVVNDMEMIINYASQRGATSSKNYAILAPNNKYGDLIVSSAKQAIASRQLNLVKVVRYPDREVNVSQYIAQLISEEERERLENIKSNLDKENKLRAIQKKSLKKMLKPQLDFDTLIIGDYGERLAVVVSHFALFDIDDANLTILGNSNWNSNSIAVEGILNGAFYPAYQQLEETNFYQDYKNFYNKSPNRMDASAYDIVKVFASLVSYDIEGDFVLNVTTSGLASKMLFTGVYGDFSVRADGIIVRPMLIYKIEKGKPVMITNSSLSYINHPNYREMVN